MRVLFHEPPFYAEGPAGAGVLLCAPTPLVAGVAAVERTSAKQKRRHREASPSMRRFRSVRMPHILTGEECSTGVKRGRRLARLPR